MRTTYRVRRVCDVEASDSCGRNDRETVLLVSTFRQGIDQSACSVIQIVSQFLQVVEIQSLASANRPLVMSAELHEQPARALGIEPQRQVESSERHYHRVSNAFAISFAPINRSSRNSGDFEGFRKGVNSTACLWLTKEGADYCGRSSPFSGGRNHLTKSATSGLLRVFEQSVALFNKMFQVRSRVLPGAVANYPGSYGAQPFGQRRFFQSFNRKRKSSEGRPSEHSANRKDPGHSPSQFPSGDIGTFTLLHDLAPGPEAMGRSPRPFLATIVNAGARRKVSA